MINPTTQITYKDLMNAWTPLIDVSMTLDRIREQAGGDAGPTIGLMDDKVKRALEPLEEYLDRIQEENPSVYRYLR